MEKNYDATDAYCLACPEEGSCPRVCGTIISTNLQYCGTVAH